MGRRPQVDRELTDEELFELAYLLRAFEAGICYSAISEPFRQRTKALLEKVTKLSGRKRYSKPGRPRKDTNDE